MYLKKQEKRLLCFETEKEEASQIGLPKLEGHKKFGYALLLISHAYFMPLFINN